MGMPDFFRVRLDAMIDLRHTLTVLDTRMPWAEIEKSLSHGHPDIAPIELIHRGKCKRLTDKQRRWLKGSEGDGLHAVLCAAGCNLWLAWLVYPIMLAHPITQQGPQTEFPRGESFRVRPHIFAPKPP